MAKSDLSLAAKLAIASQNKNIEQNIGRLSKVNCLIAAVSNVIKSENAKLQVLVLLCPLLKSLPGNNNSSLVSITDAIGVSLPVQLLFDLLSLILLSRITSFHSSVEVVMTSVISSSLALIVILLNLLKSLRWFSSLTMI